MVFRFGLLLTLAVAPFGAAAAADRWTVMIDGRNSYAQGCVASSGDSRWERICLFYYCYPPAPDGYLMHLYVDFLGARDFQFFDTLEELLVAISIDGTSYGQALLTKGGHGGEQYLFPDGWDHAPLFAGVRAGHVMTIQAQPVPGQKMPLDIQIPLPGSAHAIGTMLSHCPPN
jgi:hypothetical protein